VTARRELAMARAVGLQLAGYLLLASAYTAAVWVVVREAVAGGHSPGDVALLLSLAAVLIGAAMVASRFSSVIARSVAVSTRYRRGLSASFQDFVRFELPTRESVGIGDLDRRGDDEALRSALARARCEFVYELPRGWDTQLGREWEGGVELSGGQWQKLAIAR